MGENSRKSNPSLTQNANNAMSDDRDDGHRLAVKPGASGKTPVKKAPAQAHNKAKTEEFGERGMGVAGKE